MTEVVGNGAFLSHSTGTSSPGGLASARCTRTSPSSAQAKLVQPLPVTFPSTVASMSQMQERPEPPPHLVHAVLFSVIRSATGQSSVTAVDQGSTQRRGAFDEIALVAHIFGA